MTFRVARDGMGFLRSLVVIAAAVVGFAATAEAQAPATRLEISTNLLPQGYQLQVRVVGDDAGVVKAIRVRSRREGERTWMTSNGDIASIATLTSADYYVEALDVNGAVVLREGTEALPHTVGKPAGIALAPLEAPRTNTFSPDKDPKKGGNALPWVLAGAGVVAVAATVIIVVLATSGDSAPKGATIVSPPMLQ